MGSEWTLAEKPTIECLQGMGYRFVPSSDHHALRDGENHTLFRPILIDAIRRINGVAEADARAAYVELLAKDDNEEWLGILRGNYSRTVQGKATKQTLRVIDFQNPANNVFTVTNQLYVKAEKSRIPDVVIHVNGIPVVVIELKSPLNGKDKSGEAFDQIRQYERDIPRLFFANAFNIVSDGTNCLYGATGSPSKFYGAWGDPFPRAADEFTDELSKGLWSLLEPARLLDLIAHFVVFETARSGKVKKICRYQQFRAVNKIVTRIIEGKHRRGLIWHTQGSGKSLTMVFAALKLKTHLTLNHPALTNPNIMVLTDRIDLDDQISRTFQACGLPNPQRAESVADLRSVIGKGVNGLTVLSTIFKFAGSKQAIADSASWIVMVDECHRTQEKDLGAFLRATMPDARFFGFTGTPVKKDDKDTYANFGVEGEGYLDKYGIDDAVADGATVPIHYTGRKTDWHIDEAKIDILFDNWFADLPDDKMALLKKRGVTIADLVKHPKRIPLIAYDIWTHFKAYALPDGLKAQIVAFDREAVILYKQAMDAVIAEDLVKQGVPEAEAQAQAAAMSACVYSKSQEDDKPSEDPQVDAVRAELRRHYLDYDAEKDAKEAFDKRGQAPHFLIVCDKLLTGFDAPAECVMYLDKPLKEHTLLQAIARANRVADGKRNGLIVDYIGVSRNLDDALSSYRADDVKNAMRDLDDLRSQLRAAHAAVMKLAKGVKRGTGNLKAEYDALVKALNTEDYWFEFRTKAREFIGLYQALSPDTSVLEFTADLKWVANFLQYGTQVFEKKEAFDQREYSRKIRDMLAEHLDATGLSVTVKLRHITDPDFWTDFDPEGKDEDDLKTAAIRKTTELRKVTYEKVADNPHQYGKFSDRLKELLRKMDDAQLSWAEKLKAAEELAKDIQAEEMAHEGTGLSQAAFGILAVLKAFDAQGDANAVEILAKDIEALYTDDASAPSLWQEKPELRKTLRQKVRQMAHGLGFADMIALSEQVEEFALKYLEKD
ncbi:type I restriction endonuclease subunit R [Magnetospirillum sulfuroxidans]|uniref:Type I restriction enzyme endonuclease subunit n=1 Tax=Magnetospirillum sulfuroxidans TaxID=611300 RepID=A0ABS5IC88_9PROT|nr:type I restriction endonuclease subunit R [Magnetospirillum sulfuroxidans]MBR9972041.1 type I restriction endonuclease subunit R [Magnetospirillum sulfuroxidans]